MARKSLGICALHRFGIVEDRCDIGIRHTFRPQRVNGQALVGLLAAGDGIEFVGGAAPGGRGLFCSRAESKRTD